MSKQIRLEDFNRLEVKIDYEKIVKKYADKAKNTLMAISPKSGRPGRSTPYYSGWEVSEKSPRGGLKETVWNRTNWQLTHLLENGHWISNSAHPAIAWSAPRKHIKPTFDQVKPQYIQAMKKVKIDADFK